MVDTFVPQASGSRTPSTDAARPPAASSLASGAVQMAGQASPQAAKIAPTASAVLGALNSGGDPASIASQIASPAAGMINPVAGQAVSIGQSAVQAFGASGQSSPQTLSGGAAGGVASGASPAAPSLVPDDSPMNGRALSDLTSSPQFFASHPVAADAPAAVASSGLDDSTRLMRLQTPLAADKRLFVETLEGGEGLSQVGQYSLQLLSTNQAIDLKDVLNQPFTIFIKRADGSEQPIHGYVASFGFVAMDGGFAHYHGNLVSWLWFLNKRVNSRIYQQLTVLDVVRKVFKDYGPFADFEVRVQKAPTPVDYIVQHDETDLNFVSRLLEQAGLFYYFEHRPDGHKLIIADDSANAACCPVQAQYPELTYNGDAHVDMQDTMTSLSASRELQSGAVALNTYDYKKPGDQPYVEMPTVADQGNVPKLEVFDGTSSFAYADRAGGEAEARRRMEVLEWQAKLFTANTNTRDQTVGHTFQLVRHPWFEGGDANDATFLVVDLHVSAKNNLGDQQGHGVYANRMTLIRHKIPYRPIQRHAKPVMRGPQSAIVVGPKGEEIHTDAYGRIKVQFRWDRYGKNDAGSSCWVRVSQPWAGRGWGTVAVPRVNQEVIVDFFDGDPDRPVVVGRLFNAEQTPPYSLPEGAHQMGFHSNSTPGGGGFCEMVIHDKKGEELVNIHSQKDMATTVQNNHTTVVNGPSQINAVTTGCHVSTVKKYVRVQSQDESISHTAKTFQELHAEDAHIAAKAKGAVQIESDGAHIYLKAAQNITLEVGGSKLVMNQDGTIVLSGKLVTLIGTTKVDLNPDGGAAPPSPALIPLSTAAAPAPASPATSGGGAGGGMSSGTRTSAAAANAPAAAPAPHRGDLSMRYETGQTPDHFAEAAAKVSSGHNDPGGKSYGAYQLASSAHGGNQVQAFLQSPEGAPYASQFQGMDPQVPGAFEDRWKQTAQSDPQGFFDAQHAYIDRTHYQPVLDQTLTDTGVDLSTHSQAVQDAAWSMGVQHHAAPTLVSQTVASMQIPPSDPNYDHALINALYDKRTSYVDGLGLPSATQQSLDARYVDERARALAMATGNP